MNQLIPFEEEARLKINSEHSHMGLKSVAEQIVEFAQTHAITFTLRHADIPC